MNAYERTRSLDCWRWAPAPWHGAGLRLGRADLLFGVALAFLLMVSTVQAQTAVAPTSGTGTVSNPYPITELGNLVWMSDNVTTEGVLGKYYRLVNVIDASDTANWTDHGTTTSLVGFPPIGSAASPFRGAFDGNGKKITNLAINRTSWYVGLFGCVGPGGEVKNLGLERVVVSGGNDADVGGLVGWNTSGTITNCYATGAVSSGDDDVDVGGLVGRNEGGAITNSYATDTVSSGDDDYNADVGGLVGRNVGGTMTNCYATGGVSGSSDLGGLVGFNDLSGTIASCYATGAVSGDGSVGGLVGTNYSGTLLNCYAIGKVSDGGHVAWEIVGGLVGRNYGAITNCYASGGVSGTAQFGGLVGHLTSGTITNSYWDTQTSGQSASEGGAGRTTAQMKQQVTFVGWDFGNVWRLVENVTYPFLRTMLPHRPTGVVASDGAFRDRVRIVWGATFGAADFKVYRSTHPATATATSLTSWAAGTSYDDLTAEPGVIYYYWVAAATDAAGGSASGLGGGDSGWAGAGVAFPSNYRGAIWMVH